MFRTRASYRNPGSGRAALPPAVWCIVVALMLSGPSAWAKKDKSGSPSQGRNATQSAESSTTSTTSVGVPCTGANEVLDLKTGLCWEYSVVDVERTVADGQAYCAGLGADWRVPTIDELRTTIDTEDVTGCGYTAPGGPCLVSDPGCLDEFCGRTCVDACDSGGHLAAIFDQTQELNRWAIGSSSILTEWGGPYYIQYKYGWLDGSGAGGTFHWRCVADAEPCGDADGDAVCDATDLCEGDDATGDDDGDGTCNGLDLCPADRFKTAPGWCGCGSAEGSCDNGVICNGYNEVADPVTGLCWQQSVARNVYSWHDPIDHRTLQEAEIYCKLQGPGWRVPTIDELRTIIAPTCPEQTYGGSCGLTAPTCLGSSCDDNCSYCQHGGHLLDILNQQHDDIYSSMSSSINPDTNEHWTIQFDMAYIHGKGVADKDYVRCVANLGSGTVIAHCVGIGDADNDGVCDPSDACTGNDKYGDEDQDGVCEDLDVCVGNDALGDSDSDGSCDDADLCVGDDRNGDADGDGTCEELDGVCGGPDTSDIDNDGICNSDDICPRHSRADDQDLDGTCDYYDVCVQDRYNDRDSDGACDVSDPCPLDPNDDADGDGLCANVDLCLGDNSYGDAGGDGICDEPIVTIIEDFEAGTWPWAPWVETGVTYAVRTAPEGAHDGSIGLELAEIPTYRTDVSFGLVQDEVLAAWVQPGMSTEGRIEIGFNADAMGGYMLRLDSYTDTLSFRSNDFNGNDVELALTTANVEPENWYLLEIQVGANGLFEGRVLASDGTTLVANLFHTFAGLSGMGIAFNGNMNNRLDTIHVYLSVGNCSDSDGDGVCDTNDICQGDDAFGDTDGDGVCEDIDICIGFDWLGDADSDGYCDQHECAADVPPFYDQSVSEASWTAGGACAEFGGLAGPTVCAQTEHQQHLDDMNWIIANYPWANSVFDAQSGSYQGWGYSPYNLSCSNFPSMLDQQYIFDDLNACYQGHSGWNGAFNGATISFDWGVNVWKLVTDYNARAETYGGACSLSGFGGGATGFHVSDQGGGARLWTVQATDNCDFYGCRCDATVQVQTNPITQPGVYTEMSLTNQSTFTLYEGMLCEDARFNF